MTEAKHSLLTFAPMIDSETSRFILRHYGVEYRERPHIFGWGSVLALLHGSYGRLPLLYGGGLRLAGPRPIVDHFDTVCLRERMLVPSREPARTQIEADWQLFNGELAAYTAVIAYFHLLPHPDILTEPFFRGVPRYEHVLFGRTYPFLRGLISLLLKLNAAHAADALIRSRIIFDQVDRRLRDGRNRLVGDEVTLSDIAFAAAAAPLLLPEGYRASIPALAAMPQAMQAIVTEMRAHPAAAFVSAIYRACMPPEPLPTAA